MIKSTVVKTVGAFVEELNNGGIDFDYPIQRNGGQWNDEKASLLMHSFMDDYPVPPVYALVSTIQLQDEDGEESPHDIYSILDGKQRLTRIQDFISNKLQLHENTPPVTVTKGKKKIQVEVAGEYYDTLNADVKKKFLNSELSMVQINSATDEEIENVFFRLNNGEALTKTQQGKSLMGSEWAKRLTDVAKHPAMTINAQFTPLQKKKADDEMTVIQTMMIMDNLEHGRPLQSISSNHAYQYVGTFKEEAERLVPLYNKVVEGLDYIHEAFEQNAEKFLLKKVHMTAAIMTALHAKERGIAPIRYKDWTAEFDKSYKQKGDYIKTAYKTHSREGTVLGTKALGRVEEMIKHFDTYIAKSKQDGELENVVDKIKADLEQKNNKPVDEEPKVEVEEKVEVTDEVITDGKVEVTTDETTDEKVEVTENKDEAIDDEVQITLDGILG